MADRLAAALGREAWCLSDLLFGLDLVRDDEGRPLAERRAPVRAKRDCEIDLQPCPYDDERYGRPMNASALEQVLRHLKEVFDDIAGFQSVIPDGPKGWERMLLCVVDQLVAPALHLLDRPEDKECLPARKAVSHKLAAGYFGVLRDLLAEELEGAARPATVDEFLAYVQEKEALIGGSEVCAGPPQMIRRATAVLLARSSGGGSGIDRNRFLVVRILCVQIAIGLLWQRFDLCSEDELLTRIGDRLRPRTPYLVLKIKEKMSKVGSVVHPRSWGQVAERMPNLLQENRISRILASLRAHEDGAPGERETLSSLREIAESDQGAFEVPHDARSILVAHGSRYLRVRREVLAALLGLELELRSMLGFDPDVEMSVGELIMPKGHCQQWLELALGRASHLITRPVPRTASSRVAMICKNKTNFK